MFKKKPSVKPQSSLRSSDRRKIAQSIISSLSYNPTGIPEATVRNLLLPDGTSSGKFTTTHGPDLAPVNGVIYFGPHPDSEERPLWVKIDRHIPELFPTCYTLWANPTLLPILVTNGYVIERISDGADLMIPGLIAPFPEGAKLGALVGVADYRRPEVAVAVGVCEVDVSALHEVEGERGRAVRVLHWVGDEVYKWGGGGGKVPESLKVPGEGEAGVDGNMAEKLAGLEVKEKAQMEETKEAAKVDDGQEEIRQLETKEIDAAFYAALLFGLQTLASNPEALDFPLTSSAFVEKLVHPYLPPASHFPPHNYLQSQVHPSLVLKKTSWKNIAKFLKMLQGKMLVNTKTRNGGEVVVLEVNWEHPEAQSFKKYKLPEAPKEKVGGSGGAAEGEQGKIGTVKVEALYRPNGKGVKFFEEIGAGTKDFYTSADLKTMLNTYVDSNKLANPNNKRLITLNPLLSNSFFLSTPADEKDLASARGVYKRDLLAERLIKSCSPYHRITTPSGEVSKPKSGAAPKVEIIMEKRQGRKTVTRIIGLESFGVDPKQMAEELQRVCAGAATVGQAQGLKPGLMEVAVQGSMEKEVRGALEKRGVGQRLVGVTDKTGGKK
ncbi:Similar to Translation machinery-associated protein 64; acc. no. Q04600 [Pyronema omphalodes CBS 100304]|uniref:Similar to Translation machinery-associated protein 64 acc. no. Q04600 n=1 Tax=Pyronema omphalodes (strain CBS 100304) TaxID=1076935 RepID=U4KZQ4_PYROM|nr:Similar to Translation machinery-associated protein 64; acc. no. Q04600 [Pyronema omphalodes CBS 100304]